MVKVRDPRLDPLIALFDPKKVTYSEIEYLDIPGGGGKGQGLGDRVLNEVRPVDCIVAVLDAFSGLNDPKAQWEAIETDLLVSDLAVVEKRLERLALDKRKSRDLVDPKEEAALQAAMAQLESEKPIRANPELAHEPILRGFRFLSAKPILYVWNCAEGEDQGYETPDGLEGQAHIAVSARLETRTRRTAGPRRKGPLFWKTWAITESALDKVIARNLRTARTDLLFYGRRQGKSAPGPCGPAPLPLKPPE